MQNPQISGNVSLDIDLFEEINCKLIKINSGIKNKSK